jgi:Tfp pilus assembly protein PilZ
MGRDRTSPEQRRAPRVWVSFPAQVMVEERELTGVCTNVSTCGIFVQTDEPIEIGDEVRVEFEIAGRFGRDQVLVLGSVARRMPVDDPAGGGQQHGHGINFDRCMLGDDELREFIREQLGLEEADVAAPAAAIGLPMGGSDGGDFVMPEPEHPALSTIRRINSSADRPTVRWRWVAWTVPAAAVLAVEAVFVVWLVGVLRPG